MSIDRIYLTVDADKKYGGYIAVITQGHPQKGDKDITVLTVTRCKSEAEARDWYERMKIEMPWRTRQ